MKVLVCISCLMNGGTEIQTLNLVQTLIESGREVDVVCYYYYDPAMVERYRSAGARVHLLSENREVPRGSRAMLALVAKGLRRVVKEVRPDVAHVQYMHPGAYAVVLLKLLGVKKILVTHHGDCKEYSPKGLKVLRGVASCISGFQFITVTAEKNVFGSGAPFSGELPRRHGNHFTIYNALSEYIPIRSDSRVMPLPEEEMTIGVVSRLEPVKGMDLVVPAFALALRSLPKARLLVVGDGSQRSLMERQARELGVADRVTFTGRKSQDELQHYYDRIHILLMPSRSEGLGLTAIEGMARGCVPVVSDRGGLPEVVTPQCGLIHRAEDSAHMAEKIVEAASHLTQLSRGGVERSKDFSAEKYRKAIKTLYDSL